MMCVALFCSDNHHSNPLFQSQFFSKRVSETYLEPSGISTIFDWFVNTPLGFESVRSEKNCQIVGRKILY